MIHVGIDLHSDNMVKVALNDNAAVVKEAKLPTSCRSLEDFFGALASPSKPLWNAPATGCRANGVDLTLAHAKMVKAISYAKVKTDTVDGGPWPSCSGRTSSRRPIRSNMIGENYGSSPAGGCG